MWRRLRHHPCRVTDEDSVRLKLESIADAAQPIRGNYRLFAYANAKHRRRSGASAPCPACMGCAGRARGIAVSPDDITNWDAPPEGVYGVTETAVYRPGLRERDWPPRTAHGERCRWPPPLDRFFSHR